MASPSRRPLYINKNAGPAHPPHEASASTDTIWRFHQAMPEYSPTPLIPVKNVASEIGVRDVFVKFEGHRLGLPSFKILGASWATFRALTEAVGLPTTASLEELKTALRGSDIPVKLFAATDGNHGRAVARMGAILGLAVQIYVPSGLNPSTIKHIREEGAAVEELDCSYDRSVQVSFEESGKTPGGVLIGDVGFAGYEDIPEVRYSMNVSSGSRLTWLFLAISSG